MKQTNTKYTVIHRRGKVKNDCTSETQNDANLAAHTERLSSEYIS
jgi:hypothetical protein